MSSIRSIVFPLQAPHRSGASVQQDFVSLVQARKNPGCIGDRRKSKLS